MPFLAMIPKTVYMGVSVCLVVVAAALGGMLTTVSMRLDAKGQELLECNEIVGARETEIELGKSNIESLTRAIDHQNETIDAFREDGEEIARDSVTAMRNYVERREVAELKLPDRPNPEEVNQNIHDLVEGKNR